MQSVRTERIFSCSNVLGDSYFAVTRRSFGNVVLTSVIYEFFNFSVAEEGR